MEHTSKLCILVLTFAATVLAQDDLTVNFLDKSTRETFAGSQNLKFQCALNKGLLFVVQNTVQIIRRPAMGGDDVILTQAAKRVEAEPAYYNVAITPQPDNTVIVEFEIVTVRDIDDGELLCQVKTEGDGAITVEDTVSIVVIRPLSALKLMFDGMEIDSSLDDPLETDAGTYSVSCIAEGSNPAATEVHMSLGDMVDHSDPVVKMMSGGVRMYSVTIDAQLTLTSKDSMKKLECSAMSKAGDQLTTDLAIKINVYEPDINCTNTEAHIGKKYPTITCLVKHEGLEIEEYSFQLADAGSPHHEEIKEGTQNDDFVEVEREEVSDSETKVHLKLYEAQDWHFDTPFYLLARNKDGHISRAVVHLTEVPGNGDDSGDDSGDSGEDHGNFLRASLATLILSLLCARLWSL